MKIWDLERQYDELISFVLDGREKKKQNIRSAVDSIKTEILARKEEALVEFSRKWDRWGSDYPLRLSEMEIEESASKVSRKDLGVLKGMIRNVKAYHRTQKGKDRIYRRKGLLVREKFVPMERALVYVPGGTAAYPSSLIMGTVPAQLAGVKEIYVATPTPEGRMNPYIAAAASLLGIKDVYRLGGAQAIYAFAYGVGSVPKVDIIVGPGNAYVEEAKRDVYGAVGIDMLAGPTELIILCTEPFPVEALCWDMFSQAEHDELATVGLFSPSKEHLASIRKYMDEEIRKNERKAVVEKALDNNGFLVHYEDIGKAAKAINLIAPEHMELVGNEDVAEQIDYPGVIYVGPRTTVAMGDYYIGTNHVLPTGGAGRFTGGLSVDRFTKRKVVVKIDKAFVQKYGDNAIRLSRIEGLFAHGEAIRARKELKNDT